MEEGEGLVLENESNVEGDVVAFARFSSFASRPFVWPANKKSQSAKYLCPKNVDDSNAKFEAQDVRASSEGDSAEIEMLKERLSKLLLGEDMSGSGNGVQTALAISNAVTNLSASVFGQLWRLEPLPQIKKTMWRREMEYLLCVTDYIVVLNPSWHINPDGSKVEIMTSSPRSDLVENLPALRKLDNMLLEILDCFTDTEFWYIEKGLANPGIDGESSPLSTNAMQNQEEKWWLPIPQVPPGGLSEQTQKMLQHKRECAKQILKAVTAINNMTLADMEVPEFYYNDLPKHGKDCMGEKMYRYLASQTFSAKRLVAALGVLTDHQASEIANQVEAAIYTFRKKEISKDVRKIHHSSKNSYSWEMVKDFAVDGPKLELLLSRAESFLLCLKQRYPGLPQTTLDTIKIQHNKDIGKSILESYSRVLESIAFNIIGRIDDVICADDMARHPEQSAEVSVPKASSISRETTPVYDTSDTDNKEALGKKTTLISHIPSLQTSTFKDFKTPLPGDPFPSVS